LIRLDEVWMAVEPLDMRAGMDTALARVVSVFGDARAHHAYLFANKRASRMKVLAHDGLGSGSAHGDCTAGASPG
jgi:transposase